jgi:hypothetical protein
LASLSSCVTTQAPEMPSGQNGVVPEFKFPPPQPTATPTPQPPLPPPPQPQIVVNEASVLKDGIAAYNNGDYNLAIKRLSPPSEIWASSGTKAIQLEALKYTAFSYCVTGRPQICQQQFNKALKLEPTFNLAPGEKGHPLWGPVFIRAQKNLKKAPK